MSLVSESWHFSLCNWKDGEGRRGGSLFKKRTLSEAAFNGAELGYLEMLGCAVSQGLRAPVGPFIMLGSLPAGNWKFPKKCLIKVWGSVLSMRTKMKALFL